eukprot:CAMPEP_0184855606 /NCGR_PEP_ID=MMETSP0580-20130426/796_1 /TAXON_ID=1118495 /ORGANISM="Dactyliosolen fragilissimus" /LENGTH=179 /DNA_ID=CAMNT_0027350159 /DNA_START=32 /DNA_END=571 /DNA_ORIENTATION=+
MTKGRKRKDVTVVVAPSIFPDLSAYRDANLRNASCQRASVTKEKVISLTMTSRSELNFDQAAKQIHDLGSMQLKGKDKSRYEAETYKALTGREKKKQKIPIKIQRGIKKKALEREARKQKHARESGIVLASTKNDDGRWKGNKSYSEKSRKDAKLHGPSPSIGFTKKGIFRISKGRNMS